MKTRLDIASGEKVDHKGDLTIEGSIGESADVTITDGSLIVNGDVLKNAKIKLVNNDAKSGGVFFSGGSLCVTGRHSVSMINGQVWIDGVLQNPGSLYNKKPKEYSVSILGSVHDKVTIISDVEVNISKNIGENCYIKTTHGGLHAQDIGAGTTINTYGEIDVNEIKSKCKLESTSYGITANHIADEVTAKTYKDISVKTVGNNCSLQSTSYGIKANRIGQHNDIDSYKDINIDQVDDHNTLTSSSYGFNGTTVGKSVIIHTYKDIIVQNVLDSCKLTSSSYGITVKDKTENNVKMDAYKDVILNKVGNDCDVTSGSYGVRIYGTAGDNLSIQAYKDVEVNNVGSHANINSQSYGVRTNNLGPKARISSYKDIVVNGVCPTDARLNSSSGKVRKNGPVRDMSYFAPKVEVKPAAAEIPQHFLCPLTQKIMMSPVMCTEDGETYEENAIRKKLAGEGYSDAKLNAVLIPNRVMITLISNFLQAHPEQMKTLSLKK